MKRKSINLAITFAIALVFSLHTNAQEFSKLDVSPMDSAAFPNDYKESNKVVKIVYGRPQLKGRKLSDLIPQDKVWRTGANEAAEITLYKNMKVGGKTVKAGTYTFYLLPEEDGITAIINTDLNVWGSYFYNSKKDVARIKVPVTQVGESLEAFSMAFKDAGKAVHLCIGWGGSRLEVPFTK